MEEAAESGCVAFKCASAYDRGLTLKLRPKRMLSALGVCRSHRTGYLPFPELYLPGNLQNLRRARHPLQVHTGLGKMQKSSCRYLTEAIRRESAHKICPVPWQLSLADDLCGLAFSSETSMLISRWLPIISTAAAERLLSELFGYLRCRSDFLGLRYLDVRGQSGCFYWPYAKCWQRCSHSGLKPAFSSGTCQRTLRGFSPSMLNGSIIKTRNNSKEEFS